MDEQDDAGFSWFSRIFNPEKSYSELEKALDKLEPAWARTSLALRGGTRYGHQREIRAQSLLKVRNRLDVFRSRYDKGDTLSLLQAVQFCASENVPLPTWLSAAFTSALQAFTRLGGAASLDSVFTSPGLPTDTPKEIMQAVWEVAEIDSSLQSLDAALDLVLKTQRFGVGKTKARTLFNMVEKNQIEHLNAMGSNTQPLSRLFAKRRKDATR